jgi:protein-tyrosine phosphatase
MKLSGLCDLHCHYVPAVDDGVRTTEDGQLLCQSLARLGYEKLIATPHIRRGMFDNDQAGLRRVYESFIAAVGGESGMPQTGLAAEHFFDEHFFELLESGHTLPYPGGHAALVEFPPERIPLKVEERFFRMSVRGVRPVLAHPERYAQVWQSIEPMERLADRGVLLLLDLMALTGKYGRRPQRAAEELLDADLYYAACSDSHRPDDVEQVERSLERLVELVGRDETLVLLAEHPRNILAGTVQD